MNYEHSSTRILVTALSTRHRVSLPVIYFRQEAAAACDAILEGYEDATAGRLVPFNGNLRSLMKKVK